MTVQLSTPYTDGQTDSVMPIAECTV